MKKVERPQEEFGVGKEAMQATQTSHMHRSGEISSHQEPPRLGSELTLEAWVGDLQLGCGGHIRPEGGPGGLKSCGIGFVGVLGRFPLW